MKNERTGPGFTIRAMQPEEADKVAELIYESTNHWYETHGHNRIFRGKWKDCRIFTDVYGDIDPGCCLVALTGDETILGSCFYHPRKTHVSLGIMNTHPAIGRKGVAKALLIAIMDIAKDRDLPVRLVSSAFNLDSYSLYTRQGMAPFAIYQDVMIKVPESGVEVDSVPGISIREARAGDESTINTLEGEIWQTSRQGDWAYFIENKRGIWHSTVAEDASGTVVGALVSVAHPGSNMLGPGLAQSPQIATALIQTELNNHKGKSPVFLLPANNRELVGAMYALGARNCEMHVGQVLGEAPEIKGIVMPTFMPETA
ncbi:GNAT family N-acetyltransferase [Opitutia bacterium ISCC 51]|nr:GNAT family N-acetyltransferase [Opitutae bacterium ISCC 51]QXD29902.1 GNAT family N-acetyltransferase [Opitutae bacterium ISCC 52]